MKLASVLLALSVTMGCASDDQQLDGRDDNFVADGKSDTGGLHEGTPESAAVLVVANTSSRDVLAHDVGLASKAVDNIIAVRDGDDGSGGTADDAKFTTLAQLDAVPFVGPLAFGKLLAYAQANDIDGDVPAVNNDPFSTSACAGSPITADEARAARGSIGTFQFVVRSRVCDRHDPQGSYSCDSWQAEDLSWLGWGAEASGLAQLAQQDAVTDLTELQLINASCNHLDSFRTIGANCRGVGQSTISCFAYHDCAGPIKTFGDTLGLTGKLTKNCLVLTSNAMASDDRWNHDYQRYQRTEVQVGLLTRW